MVSLKFILIGTLALLSITSCSTIRSKSQDITQDDNKHKGDQWSLYPQLQSYGNPILDYLRASVSTVTAGGLGFMYGIYGPFISVLSQPIISHALYYATDGAVAKIQSPSLNYDPHEAVLVKPQRKKGRSKIHPAEVEDLRKFSRMTTDKEIKDMLNNFFSDNIYERYGQRRVF